MLLNVKRLLAEEGLHLPFDYTLQVPQSEFYGDDDRQASLHIVGEAVNRAQIAELHFAVSGRVETVCDRCLDPISRAFEYRYTHTLVKESPNGPDEDIIVDGDAVHLDQVAITDLRLDFPLKFLCREDCKGLCPLCGANLNQGDCGCDKRQIDPRLEALKELLQ
ncbi:DUF177 domain-containing protein [Acetanaerobacterium sp. MSJ-12]|uniref:YceD family protein n=1 Tax=Acetanaerobacterium sp. MSJ-12 TaxID=2841535 RepID=UPI001C0ED722|nr:DUF177 domain-containing protein [Acetanaerobacterium sp. MSJ-12]MBU5420981.1 DUF177 domain-containing protein [Acetanaerobacterium sp. MSJ-12]